MTQNPLFPTNENDDKRPQGADHAAALVRQKVAKLYIEEPNANRELQAAEATQRRSKYQQFMYELSTSGKSLAQIQADWHAYYVGLPDNEKHAIWQEFYANQALSNGNYNQLVAAATPPSEAKPPVTEHDGPVIGEGFVSPQPIDDRSLNSIRDNLKKTVGARARHLRKGPFQSLLFGLSTGFIVLLIFMFGFFNEVFIAPFIQPGRAVSSTPIIVDPSSISATSTPEIIIPKINVEIPINFSETSTNEAAIENDLENGIVHYPTTVLPGQKGNTAYFGHSSNNIFNKGKYKFAFVLLHTLQNDDIFYITYSGKVFAYKVISKTIVPPTQISVLGPVAGQTATATLITCDPPGTSINRLIVVGQQITPDPNSNSASTQAASTANASQPPLPGNGPTLLGRFWNWFSGLFH